MKIEINNESYDVERNITISELLNITPNIPKQGIAIAVNNKVVSKHKWEHEIIPDGAKITIIKAFYGG